MGLFDRFKKNKNEYDVTDMQVTDLDRGFVFEYDLKTWEVQEVYKYDWGDHFFSYEYKISSGSETRFLSVEDDDELFVVLSQKSNIRKIGEDLPELLADEKPPKKIEFDDKTFFLEEEAPGYFCNETKSKDNWVELISWTYLNEDEDEVVTLEQWGEKEFEASWGKVIKPFEISNILPAE